MSFLSWLFGKSNKKPNIEEPYKGSHPIQESVPINQKHKDSDKTEYISFFVDSPHIADYTRVGMSVKLWIPKGVKNPDKVYIYHWDGPGGCIGIVPSIYANLIASHLLDALDWNAKIKELNDNACKIKCRLFSGEETKQRASDKKESLRKESTKAYKPKNPITLTITNKNRNLIKVGEKLRTEWNDLDSYSRQDTAGG
jgi:hypothetical protein